MLKVSIRMGAFAAASVILYCLGIMFVGLIWCSVTLLDFLYHKSLLSHQEAHNLGWHVSLAIVLLGGAQL